MNVVALPPKILSMRQINAVHPELAAAYGLDPERHVSAGLVTCDQDDSLYVALDQATKAAEVDVVFAKSFYAGAGHASGPLSGEILGIIAGSDPDEVSEGLWAMREELQSRISFFEFADHAGGTAFFPHVIAETGRYLPPQANINPGDPMAYLIAPPMEASVAIDSALKAADVQLATFIAPPSETNFAGAFLKGELADLEAAAEAFVASIYDLVKHPLAAMQRPNRDRY